VSNKEEREISAQVVLRPESGKSFDGSTEITSANIQEYLPSSETIRRVRGAFISNGFDVEPVYANSFAITAKAERFEEVFHTKLQMDETHGVQVIQQDNTTGNELPLEGLPKSIIPLIEAVTFTPPPEFGPKNFGP
jgi:subtilase family serine protease